MRTSTRNCGDLIDITAQPVGLLALSEGPTDGLLLHQFINTTQLNLQQISVSLDQVFVDEMTEYLTISQEDPDVASLGFRRGDHADDGLGKQTLQVATDGQHDQGSLGHAEA